ncbi:hypothetical protein BKA00_005832 [Actinomadura coerulea]|uniref:Uncharacterized protein n=1 Tax=Actinomadura coerulea TaxID=46159 RepID=A0A7X0G3V5_9ACTN|nr:hypothetical protein [Actinomadura coerulea]MBB6398918.1 hypothetical protein [Actinomadura coerulea]
MGMVETAEEADQRARVFWSMLRVSTAKLAMDAQEQTRDPDVDDCFLWEAGYPVLWRSEEAGWVSPELRSRLDVLDHLLAQLSANRDAWTDEAITAMPLWEGTRRAARDCLALMPAAPWVAEP